MELIYIAIIAIMVYVVYFVFFRKKKIPIEEAKEMIQEQISQREAILLNTIKTSILKDYMQHETISFECGRTNFIRLNERFKHDNAKLAQIIKDWTDYMEILHSIIYERELQDVGTADESQKHFENIKNLQIRRQEIEKRFKNLLGNEYIDPEPLHEQANKIPFQRTK